MSITAMKQMLEALEFAQKGTQGWTFFLPDAITAGRQAIEQAEKQEPVAWIWEDGTITSDPDRADGTWTPLYTTPQPQPCPYIRSTREGTHHCALSQREWVGLTYEEHFALADKAGCLSADWVNYAKSIEAKLKEKNSL